MAFAGESIMRKKLKPTCDWRGRCKRKAYAEVFPGRIYLYNGYGSGGWSYLCRFHFILAKYVLRHKWAFGWVITDDKDE